MMNLKKVKKIIVEVKKEIARIKKSAPLDYEKRVTGQNGMGQNGMDKMIQTKW